MKRRRNVVWFTGLVVVLSLAVVPIASAHTGGLSASLNCNGTISWTVNSNGFAGTFTVTDSSQGGATTGSGTLSSGNSFSVSGSYDISTALTSVVVSANITWSDGFVGGEPASVTVTRPTNCVGTGFCHETVNPAGNPAVGDNGFPNDPFGGDAVPGGKDTTPGNKGNGPIQQRRLLSRRRLALQRHDADRLSRRRLRLAGQHNDQVHAVGQQQHQDHFRHRRPQQRDRVPRPSAG